MMYALVHYPNIDISRIDPFRMKHDPQFKLIRPHITLLFPVPESVGEENLIRHLERILRDQRSFRIHLQGLHISPDDYLFLLVREGAENIICLHDKIYTGILADHLRRDIPFVPHLTLGILNKDVNVRKRVVEEAQLLGLDHHCLLDKFHLLKINDDRSRIVWSRELSLVK